jgi:PIN domain nuclease of toxin-antitoxin system
MKLLLDTHALIWFLSGNNELSEEVVSEIENENNTIFVSIASLWEIGIKESIGKIKIKGGLSQLMTEILKSNIEIIPISIEDILVLTALEFFHRDPFDRLLIAQGMNEQCVIVSKDEQFKKYKIPTLW